MMGKIKLNLVSGAVVEKPLISAFKANNNSYVILDNEINGSMGLPIILVCKFENNKLIKINDQNEWQIVKEYLKNIIAGNQVEYFKIATELAADDIYYTQLTLPVPSFDALKNAYKVEETVNTDNNIIDINPVTPTVETPTPQVAQVSPVMPDINPSAPVIDINIPGTEVTQSEPVVNATPAIDLNTPIPTFGGEVATQTPVVETPTVEGTPVMPEPQVTEAPVVNDQVVNNGDIFKEQKEAFMQACENMFDALVQKFEKELENRK